MRRTGTPPDEGIGEYHRGYILRSRARFLLIPFDWAPEDMIDCDAMYKKILKKLVRLRDHLGAFSFGLAVHTFSRLPLWGVRTVSHVTFFLLYPLVGLLLGLRRRVAKNIQTAYQDTLTKREAKKIARRVIFNQLIFFTDLFFFFNPRNRGVFREQVTIEGLQHLASAARNGKGMIGVSAHLGNFQLMMLRFSIEDIRFVTLIKQPKSEIMADAWDYFMDMAGLKRIMMKNRVSALKEIVRELRRSSFVMFVADEFTRRGGHPVTFFGRKTSMAAGPSSLALRMGVPLLPTFIVREKGGNYRIIIDEPIGFVPTGDLASDVVVLTQRRVDILEEAIRKYTDQWLWTQSRWKKRRYGRA